MYNKKIQIGSSNLNSVTYNHSQRTLIVEFKGGAEYSYSPFYESSFDQLLKAPSKGKWFNENIRKNKSYVVKKI